MPSQGPRSPANVDAGAGGWDTQGNAAVLDGVYSFNDLNPAEISEGIYPNQYGFTIPSNATITGVEVTVYDSSDTSNGVVANSTRLKIGVTSSTNLEPGTTVIPTSITARTIGSSASLWGLSLTPADINGSTFGVELKYQENLAGSAQVRVDYVAITVYYTQSTDSPSGSLTSSRRTLQYQAIAEPSRAAYDVGSNKTFHWKNAAAAGSNFLSLQDGGTQPTGAVTATGWTAGTTPAGNYSLMAAGVERLAATFGATPLPDAAPNNTLGDGFRTELSYSGTFSAGDWEISISLATVTSGGDVDGNLRFRLWKSVNADGSSATALSDVLETSTFTNINGTGVAALTQALGEISLSDEYLFVQVALEITGAGGAATRDVLLRVGFSTEFAVLTPFFTEGETPSATLSPRYGSTQIRRIYRAVGY
jgi:hypothetical protein